MADQMIYEVYVTVIDSTPKSSTVSVRISSTNGKAYVAAADDAARAATSAGTLISAIEALFEGGDGAVFESGVKTRALNDGFTPLEPDSEVYNSNKLDVSYTSIVLGISRGFSLTIPQRNPAAYTVSGGNPPVVQQGLADAIDDFVTALSAVGESLYGTAISPVMEITLNDS